MLFGTKGDLILSFGGRVITSKNTICHNMELSYRCSEFHSITGHKDFIPRDGIDLKLNFACMDVSELFTTEPRIRDKRVEDCTIEELLYAVRQKIK